MVTVTGYRTVVTPEGELYVRLILEGDVELVQSSKTGNYYATTKRATISATFGEEVAKKMVGRELPGTIEKISVTPYEYTTDDGTTIELSHRWVYREEMVEQEGTILELAETAVKRTNGRSKAA